MIENIYVYYTREYMVAHVPVFDRIKAECLLILLEFPRTFSDCSNLVNIPSFMTAEMS